MSPSSSCGLWRPPLWAGLAWGFAEATFFFLVPDILLSWAALSGARHGIKMFASILVGSLLGGLLMYEWAVRDPAQSVNVVARVPFVRPAMFENVSRDYQSHGSSALLIGPGSGIPYKVYAVLAPPVCPLEEFLHVSIPARAERMALSWMAFSLCGVILHSRIAKHPRRTAVVFCGFWMILYAFYWSRL